MLSSDLNGLGQACANAMLTTKTSKVLSAAIHGHEIAPQQLEVLRRAAQLVSRIVEGSLLIDGRQVTGFSASHRGLEEYERALSALRVLRLLSSDFTDLFVGYRQSLLSVADRQSVPAEDLIALKRFFGALSEFFYSDLASPVVDDSGDRLQLET
jgi:hypothetical protein